MALGVARGRIYRFPIYLRRHPYNIVRVCDEERQSIITVLMTLTIYLDPQMADNTL